MGNTKKSIPEHPLDTRVDSEPRAQAAPGTQLFHDVNDALNGPFSLKDRYPRIRVAASNHRTPADERSVARTARPSA